MFVIGGNLHDVELSAHLFALLEEDNTFFVQDGSLTVDNGAWLEEFPGGKPIIIVFWWHFWLNKGVYCRVYEICCFTRLIRTIGVEFLAISPLFLQWWRRLRHYLAFLWCTRELLGFTRWHGDTPCGGLRDSPVISGANARAYSEFTMSAAWGLTGR